METSSSSKVTVEYHDPSSIFPLISRELASRLPLRNLNWQSNARPLRQIKSLHVDFVPDRYTQATLQPIASRNDHGLNSFDIVGSGADANKGTNKQRRHQIPGLKTTPYLRVYILRCDDKEAYKHSDRQRVKTWIRENGPREDKSEKHDACEWLIVHVVIPDTIAASEPRWREANSSKISDELKERPKAGGAKWPGKSTKTVFDRLRADFNENKSTPDRVAQIRLLKSQVSPDLLPTPAIAVTLDETSEEREKAWNDLMTKIKSLILNPFDARVRQYEDDIAEQEARRSLPGWNFCTFFIHKEGLAKALESVGLVEDALAIYDELGLGLETALREIASGKADGTATSFPPFTADIKDRIIGDKHDSVNGAHAPDMKSASQHIFAKPYRDEIVTSRISVFDFFCYLFVRQKALILRLAGSSSAKPEFGSKEGGEDLVMSAEICWRALNFIHNAARTLRQDLQCNSENFTPADVESMVSSWSFLAAEFVLDETYSTLLDISDTGIQSPGKLPSSNVESPRRVDFGFGMGADPYPQRMSSLPTRKRMSAVPEMKPVTEISSSERISEEVTSNVNSGTATDIAKTAEKPGLTELAAYRAELVSLQRKMLGVLAGERGWVAGWATLRGTESAKMEEVDLNDDKATEQSSDHEFSRSPDKEPSNLISSQLITLLESKEAFEGAYEFLTEAAARHYLSATHVKSAETLMGDMAMLKYSQGEYAVASTFFAHVLSMYSTDGWSRMEAQALSLNAKCHRELGKKDDYAKDVLEVLAKVAGQRIESALPHTRSIPGLFDDFFDATGLFQELVTLTKEMSHDTAAPMVKYFADIELDHEIFHLDDQDGFGYKLRFRHVLDDDITLDEITIRLVHVDDTANEILLTTDSPVTLNQGKIEVELRSTTTAFGLFNIDRIVLKAEKLHFVHDLRPEPQQTPLGITGATAPEETDGGSQKRPYLLLYPPPQAFDVHVELARNTNLDKARLISVRLESGWNEVEEIEIKLKPATAGLRLHLADASFDGIAVRAKEASKQGVLVLDNLAENSSATASVRYTLEQAAAELCVRAEVTYKTKNNTFRFLRTVKLATQLPLDVDVNDIFRHDALFSQFTVRTTNGTPLMLEHVELRDSKVYAVEAPPVKLEPIIVLGDQPVSLAYKVTRKGASSGNASKADAAMVMALDYVSIEEIIFSSLQSAFEKDLTRSDFKHLTRLLLPVLAERAKNLYRASDMELTALLHECAVPSFADLGWFEVIDTLPTASQRALSDWLMRWHINNQRIKTKAGADDPAAKRRITIRVDVPNIDVVFSASLRLQAPDRSITSGPQVLTLGKPVHAELRIRHTRDWSASAVLGQPKLKTAVKRIDPKEFVFDIEATPDTWLIGGRRRARFMKDEANEASITIILVPLRVGLHGLPQVEVQRILPEGQERPGNAEQDISCETNFESAGQVVRVIRDQRTTEVVVLEDG